MYSYDKEKVIKNFRKLLRYRTVEKNKAAFAGFREALKELYPCIHKTCLLETVEPEGIMYVWKGLNPEKNDSPPSVILMSHYDVVPADTAEWLYPPFSATEADGRIYARGTLDTKGTFCAVMESVEALISQGFTPKSDIYLCFGGDEETTGRSAINIAALLEKRNVRPYLVLDEGGAIVDASVAGIKRPCALVGIAEKGYMDIEFITKGIGGHTSIGGASNPIVVMAEVVKRLNPRIFKARLNKPLRITLNSVAKNAGFIRGELFKSYLLWGKLFRGFLVKKLPEIDAMTRTIGAITQISGGSAENVIPEQVRAVGNFRIISGSNADETLALIKKALSGIDVELRVMSSLEPSGISDISGRGWESLSGAISSIWGNSAVIPYLMLARSDSRSYSGISNNIYRFTPVTMTKVERVSIHGVNENISKENFYKMIEFYITLITDN